MSVIGLATEIKDLATFVINNYKDEDACDLTDYKLEQKLKHARALLQDTRKLVRRITVNQTQTQEENQ